MVSMSCFMVTLSPPSVEIDPCLVLLGGSQHDYEWDNHMKKMLLKKNTKIYGGLDQNSYSKKNDT